MTSDTAETGNVLIRGGLVADGSGCEPKPSDILVRGGQIVAVELPGVIPAGYALAIDATDLVIAPGFIDVHSHADNAPMLEADDTSKILQGVTTEVVGNCGFSLAPVGLDSSAAFASFSQRIFPKMDFTWSTWKELMAQTDALGYVTNYAPLVGHGTVRIAVLGMDDSVPNDDELAAMGRELDRALEAGAFGMSSGLAYPPAVSSETEELVSLARHLGRDGLYVTHMRGQGSSLLSSVAETIRVGIEGGCRVHVSHLKSAGRANWGRIPAALDRIHDAAGGGLAITKDIYPYTASSTMLTALLPPPFLADGNEAVLARLRSTDRCRELAKVMEGGLPGWDSHLESAGWDGILISSTGSHRYEGSTIAELSRQLELSPVNVLVKVLREERLQATMVLFSMHESDVRSALADSDTMVGSDGLPPGGGGKPHPRVFGTFPRIFGEYVRNSGLLSLGEAVRRTTALPAETFRIPSRGRIRKGFIADLVAFDPSSIDHDCDYRNPVQSPRGVAWVMQEGHLTVDGQSYIGPRRGRRLTPASSR